MLLLQAGNLLMEIIFGDDKMNKNILIQMNFAEIEQRLINILIKNDLQELLITEKDLYSAIAKLAKIDRKNVKSMCHGFMYHTILLRK